MTLQIENLSQTYRTGDVALRGVNISVPDGEILALVGPSGAGKSTLIRCINRLVEPTTGRIVLGGTDITALGARDLRLQRQHIGMIFQEFALVDRLTVMENVLSGRLGSVGFWASWFRRFPPGDVARAFELLERVGLGTSTEQVNKRADALSGGQRQRVGIARALMHARDLLLVDEPTASLDPRTARQIMRLLVELARERKLTAIINLHDIPLAQRFVDRIVGLRDGELVFDGTPDELTPDALTRIYGAEDWTGSREGKATADDADASDDEGDDEVPAP
ncbi:MAG: phosphonate ABC transporter ATP-binding protein [Planctomycetota bacterium]